MAKSTCRAVSAISSEERNAYRNLLLREWRPELSANELAFLSYVIDLTIEWGRDQLDTTVDQMIEGVPSSDPAWPWQRPPIGIAKRTLERVMRELRDKGVILVEARRNACSIIRVNPAGSPSERVRSYNALKLAREGQTTATAADIESFDASITAMVAGNNRHGGGPYKPTDKPT